MYTTVETSSSWTWLIGFGGEHRSNFTFLLWYNKYTGIPHLNGIVGYFYSARSLKQQSADRHVTPLGHIILIPSQPVFALSP
jgi:hypothetical protein